MYDAYRNKSIANKVETRYIKEYSNNEGVNELDEFAEKQGLKKIAYEDLPSSDIQGFPVGNKRNEKGELIYYFQDIAHELCCGTTRIGKTTGLLEPRLRALAYRKNKPCLFISDPKGELFERNARFLKEQGYKMYLINFKDALFSNQWNPLVPVYDRWIMLKDCCDKIKHHKSLDGLGKYILNDSKENFYRKKEFWSVDDNAYTEKEDAENAVEGIRNEIKSDVDDMISQLVTTFSQEAMDKSRDIIWELGAQGIIKGLIYLMLEDALDERSGFSREHMSFKTMQEYYCTIRNGLFSSTNNTTNPIKLSRKFRHKNYTDESMKFLRPTLENAASTARSYLGVFDNMMQKWFTYKVYSIATDHEISVEGYEKQPFVVFLITRDYDKSDFRIAGMFIDWLYQCMIVKADKNGGRLEREMYFLCDEFGNIPQINDFSTKISTSLSRRIGFQLYVQSYAQIDAVYGGEQSVIIRDNCNVHTFLGSQNYSTKSTFSTSCGTKTVPSLSSKLNPGEKRTLDTAVISVKDIESLRPGEMYTKKNGCPVLKTEFVRSYLCEEFRDEPTTPGEIGFRSCRPDDEKFAYGYLRNEMSMEEYDVARHVENSEADLDMISEKALFNKFFKAADN